MARPTPDRLDVRPGIFVVVIVPPQHAESLLIRFHSLAGFDVKIVQVVVCLQLPQRDRVSTRNVVSEKQVPDQ